MDDIALLEAPKIDSIDLDKGFDEKEVELLIKYELPSPTDLYKGIKNKEVDFKFYDNKVSKLINDLRLPKANAIRFIKSAKKSGDEMKLVKNLKKLERINEKN